MTSASEIIKGALDEARKRGTALLFRRDWSSSTGWRGQERRRSTAPFRSLEVAVGIELRADHELDSLTE
jgi:hypothetical protein